MEIEVDLYSPEKTFKLVYDDGGNVILNRNNIVLQHRTTGEIGYLENTAANRALLNIQSTCCDDQEDTQIEIEYYGQSKFSHEDTEGHWSDVETNKLISIYRDNIKKFRNPRIKKKELWRNVASYFPTKTPDDCDKKFRSLKHHYLRLYKRKKRTRHGPVTWPYFHVMNEIMESWEDQQNTRIETEVYAQAEFSHEEHWTDADTKKLIFLYRENIEKFRNPKIKKKELWRTIASQFPTKTFDNCDKKFRNLKQHYVYVSKNKEAGQGAVTWPYFHLMDEVLGTNSNINAIQEINMIETYTKKENIPESKPGTSTQEQHQEIPRKNTLIRKSNMEISEILIHSEQRQAKIEEKVDRLIECVTESNNIQQERNKLLETYVKLYKAKE